jgi:hypothetical protein
MTRVWAKDPDGKAPEGKFLVVRRDGTVPRWPHFVLGARDPCVPIALRAYAAKAQSLGYDQAYVDSVVELASDFERYCEAHGEGDPDAGPHRKDDPQVISAMRGEFSMLYVGPLPPARPSDDI